TQTGPTSLPALALHDALPIWSRNAAHDPASPKPSRDWRTCPPKLRQERRRMRRLRVIRGWKDVAPGDRGAAVAMGSFDGVHKGRSEEHTSELQSRGHLVCRLL